MPKATPIAFQTLVSQVSCLSRVLIAAFAMYMLTQRNEAAAAQYEIIFQEGSYSFDPSKPPSDLNNKYLAKVTIKKDGQVLLENIRASTLPDAAVFYNIWHPDRGAQPPRDGNVEEIFAKLETDAASLRQRWTSRGDSFARNISMIVELMAAINSVPVIWSGEYKFVMGIHQPNRPAAERKHGSPHVPRLQGSSDTTPYDGRTRSPAASVDGGAILTINKNSAQQMRKLARGINVHDGRRSHAYKDSEGCLTIHPDYWARFHQALPSPAEWVAGSHTGKVVIVR